MLHSSEKWVLETDGRNASKTYEQRQLDQWLYNVMSHDIPDIPEALNLLDQGATNDHVDSIGWTALYFACKDGYLELVKKILQIFPTQIERKTFHNGLTPLYISLQKENTEIWKYLIQQGAANPVYWLLIEGHVDINEDKLDFIYDNRNFAITLKEDFQMIKETKSVTNANIIRGISQLARYCEKYGEKYMQQSLAQEYSIQVTYPSLSTYTVYLYISLRGRKDYLSPLICCIIRTRSPGDMNKKFMATNKAFSLPITSAKVICAER